MKLLLTPRLVLIGLCELLALALAYEILAPIPDPDAAMAAPSPAAIVPANVAIFVPPPESRFAEIDKRPLFNPARTPFAVDVPQTDQPPSAPTAALIGVIIDGANRLALVKSSGSPLSTALAVGGQLDTWRVAEIDPDQVILTTSKYRAVMKLSPHHDANGADQTSTPNPGIGAPAMPEMPRTNSPGVNPVPAAVAPGPAMPYGAPTTPSGRSGPAISTIQSHSP